MQTLLEARKPRRIARRVVATGAVLLVLVLIALALKNLLAQDEGRKRKVVHQIALLRPPPPPPPPPQQEKPPEPKEEVKVPEPDKVPEQAQQPAGEQLAVDSDGSAGPGDLAA